MLVELKVNAQHEIKFIRTNIENSNYVPIFTPGFYYPENGDVEIAFTIDMDNISENDSPPFYLHIAVDDGIKLTHEYLEINLINAPLKYLGLNLITYSDQTRVVLYDSLHVEIKTINLNGTYVNSDISTADQLFFLTTAAPAKLYAFDQKELELKWFNVPEMPFPYYTDLYEDGNYLFAGFGNERIAAFDGISGIQKIGTQILVDSIPIKIGASNSYFVGYFEKRTSEKKAMVSFYLASGATYKKLETYISVVDFYPADESDVLSVFGNKNDKGILTSFSIDENMFGDMIEISEGLITNSCFIDQNLFLISIENRVYEIVHNTNYIDLKFELPDDLIDIQYDPVNRIVYAAQSDGIYLYRYPDYANLGFISSEDPVKAIRLYYGY